MPTSPAVRRVALAYGAFALVVAALVVAALLAAGVGVLWSAAVAVVAGVALSAVVFLRADHMALRAVGARPVRPGELPQLENLVEGLTIAHGFRAPALHAVDDGAPNALVVGRSPRHGALVVTSGLLERLERIELEGVLAHELSRIRHRETLANVTAATLIGRPLGFSPRLAGSLAAHLVDTDLALRADLTGAAITRYPPGLAGALTSVRADGRVVKANPRAYRHLWFNPPADALVDQAFTLDDRIDVLHEL